MVTRRRKRGRLHWLVGCCGLAMLVVTTTLTATAQSASPAGTGVVSGTVVDSSGKPLANHPVTLSVVRIGVGTSTHTNARGQYQFTGIPPGIYQVYAEDTWRPEHARYLRDYWKNGTSSFDATSFVLRPGELERNKNIVQTASSSIAGDVEVVGGAVTDTLRVRAYREEDGQWLVEGSGLVAASGAYFVGGLRAGTYRLEFTDRHQLSGSGRVVEDIAREFWPDQLTLDAATDIPVGVADAVNRNATLEASGAVTGRVDLVPQGSQGSSGQGPQVTVYRRSLDGWEHVASGSVLPDGTFEVTGLPSGEYRALAEEPYANGIYYAEEAFGGAPDVASGTSFTVESGGLTPGIDFSLESSTASISGQVEQVGTRRRSVEVRVFRRDAAGDWQHVLHGAFVQAGGSYTVTGLQPGTYRLRFFNEFGRVIEKFWPDASSLADAQDIEVSSRQSQVTGKDVSVVSTATISGTLVAPPSDLPLYLGQVTAYRQHGSEWRAVARMRKSAGEYEFVSLVPGTYRIGFYDNLFNILADEYYGESGSFAGATDVHVGAGDEITDADIPLEYGVSSLRRPKLLGMPRVGVTLRADPGDWTPAETSRRVQWLADGQPIGGASGRTFTLTRAHLGKRISIRVTGVLAGFRSTSDVSPSTVPVGPLLGTVRHAERPRILGMPRVGEQLRVVGGRWTPSSVRLVYEWRADGRQFRRTGRPTLVLGPRHVGSRISVRVIGTADGFRPDAATTRSSAPVRARSER